MAIVVSPDRYDEVLAAVEAGGFTLEQRKQLALEAFTHTASYDIAVASWMGSVLAPGGSVNGFPEWVGASWDRGAVLRYGENPHQRAAMYKQAHGAPGLAQAEQLHGKEMSYNNYIDSDAARRAAYDHQEPCVAIIKHANPCGIAIAADVADCLPQSIRVRPSVRIRGGRRDEPPGHAAMAEAMADVFTEVVVAPRFRRGCAATCCKRRRMSDSCVAPAFIRGPVSKLVRSAVGCCCSRSMTSRQTATTPQAGSWLR